MPRTIQLEPVFRFESALSLLCSMLLGPEIINNIEQIFRVPKQGAYWCELYLRAEGLSINM